MTLEEFEAVCLALPATSVVVQWGGTHVYKVGGKMFALAGTGPWRFAFKASDLAFELLPEQGLARPAPYLQRARWLAVDDAGALGEGELARYVEQPHGLVAGKLPKKARAALGLA
ncbi:MAG TPA: MmcQ/YjbR family DNA-binding protein [Caulobacteraceae bacterium]|nr:MmcQ/YjbR family DNA-binding protein [Caulobacteraceae bacterium]